MVKLYIAVIFTFFLSDKFAEQNYIDHYSSLAISEMNRSGIPASIILAQGILESNNGKSRLARSSNNHFGIKCKSYWTGGKYYHYDDDFDRNGKPIKSCFRSYDSVKDSYVDHSNFLLQSDRYSGLFLLKNNYKKWSHGLKSSGYATDPSYAEKLIKVIERNKLYEFDITSKKTSSTHDWGEERIKEYPKPKRQKFVY
jgi:flagellum-specific peptidoglycan hydrolase FlgJ